MSKIAKKPIVLTAGIKLEMKDNLLKFSGKEGNLDLPILDFINVEIKDNAIILTPLKEHKQARANWGTMAALIRNAIEGVSTGFTRTLEIEGIGFKAAMEGVNLTLNVGFTHPVKYQTPAGVKISIEKNIIKVFGINKNLVGQVAAQIRKIRKPEPYKGKGIHYTGEVVRRKVGKKVAGVGSTGAA